MPDAYSCWYDLSLNARVYLVPAAALDVLVHDLAEQLGYDLTRRAPCRKCTSPIGPLEDHARLGLCGLHACEGLLAYCVHCGENYPEHGPGGKGCAQWEQRPETPKEGEGDDDV
jgi:hypothetical protein